MIEQTGTILIVSIVLGLDAFSLSMGMGLKGVKRDYEIRFAGLVGILHVIMPLVGLYLGLAVGRLLGIWAARIGALILAYIGFDLLIKGYKEIREKRYSFSQAKGILKKESNDSKTGWASILLLGVSVSIDALTVGFSLGTLKMPILITVAIMGAVAAIMTFIGFLGGRLFSRMIGTYAQIIGGITLLGLAVKLLI